MNEATVTIRNEDGEEVTFHLRDVSFEGKRPIKKGEAQDSGLESDGPAVVLIWGFTKE